MNTYLDTLNLMNTNEIRNMINTIPTNFKENDLFYNLFNFNNYTTIIDTANRLSGFKVSNKDNLIDLKKLEKMAIEDYSILTGKITIDIKENLLNNLKNTDTSNIQLSDIKNLPFESFKIDAKFFENISDIFVVYKDNKLYVDFSNIGKEKVSIQMVWDKDKDNNKIIIPQYTMSSLFYHKEISHISNETQLVAENAFENIVSILLYLINSNKDKDTIIKTMNYDDYKLKQSDKLSKHKVKNKLNKKNNVITLQYGKSVKYINSVSNSIKWKNNKRFLVRGHFRKQPIGKRDGGEYRIIWIQPFFKGSKNDTTFNKVYKVA